MAERHAVVLLSGGLDSTVTLASAIDDGNFIHALTFNYGQRHDKELKAAKDIIEFYIIRDHIILELDLQAISKSALLNKSQQLPENRKLESMSKEIPSTYVPARNIIMLSCAASWAESINANTVYIGVNSIDYSGYPDCRPEFLKAFEQAINLGTKTGVNGEPVTINYPLINLTKSEIIKTGAKLGVPFQLTWSCYKGGEKACGKCDSCQLRLKGFKEAGIADPIEYELS